MKNLKQIFVIFVITTTVLFSCKDTEYLDSTIEQTFIEFPQQTISNIISYSENDIVRLGIPIQCFGKEISQESNISIRIKGGTASNNIHFTYDSLYIVKPQTSIDTVYINVNTDELVSGRSYSIIFELTSSNSNISISKNYKQCMLYFSQETFIEFFTGTYSCFESNTNSNYEVKFIKLNDSIVKNDNFWDFPLEGEIVEYLFNDNSSNLVEIPEQDWIDKTGNRYVVYGDGTYTLDGNFIVDYFIENENGDLYQSGTHTFTKQ